MKDLALFIRSMTGREGNHRDNAPQYLMHTAYVPSGSA
jgi:hypothetical protein